ncbi:MAG TPA: hypothetical protein VFD04_08225 [Actinomycetes bacterium]|nr:hypothetical protein [Actinomycetes bacterium]
MPVTNVALRPDRLDAVSAEGPLAVEAMFRFLGTDVRVVSASVDLLQHWTAEYGAFRVPPGPAEITVHVDAASHGAPVPGQVTIERDGLRVPWRGTGPVLPPLTVPPLDRWVGLHGAAVGRAGQAVLLLGAPHTGKTLLALSAVALGARLLADGLLLLDPGDLLLAPFPQALRLRHEELALLGIDPAHPALVPFRPRRRAVQWRADPAALLGHRADRVAAGITAVVFLEPDEQDERPRLRPLAPERALAWLPRHLGEPGADPARVEPVLARLCRQVPAFTLPPAIRVGAAEAVDRLLQA